MPQPTFDLLLFGATGFTGQQTLKHLVAHVPPGFSWAIGGRNKAKLEALLPLAAASASPPKIVVADAVDARSVARAVGQTRTVIQLAGPYAAHGELFVRAAVNKGVHYLDLTGEIPWVAEIAARYHDKAVTTGCKIVPVAGFEALPFDIASLMAAKALLSQTGERANRIELINRFTGPPAWRPRDVLSGGTTASIRQMLTSGDALQLGDPGLLVSDATLADAIRAAHPYDFTPVQDEDGAWLAPTLPAPFVNPPVVYRSMALWGARGSPFAKNCGYREWISTKGMAPLSLGQRALAELLAFAFRGAASSREPTAIQRAQREALAKLIEWLGPATGEGPSERHLEESGYHMRVTATSATGNRAVVLANARGHPGYKSTAMLVAEAALMLAGAPCPGVGRLPKRTGVLTPALAFGDAATAAWARAGLTFEASA